MIMPALRGLLDLVAPDRCPGCDAVREPGESGFCEVCAELIEPLPDPLRARSGYAYGGPMAEAIVALKHRRRTDYSAALGALLAFSAAPLRGRIDAVVPVPLHPHRLRVRGYNVAQLLSTHVARALGVPVQHGLLVRVRDTPSSRGRGRQERLESVRNSFCARAATSRDLLVIDDVRTTGATFDDATRALGAAGARTVHTLALAGVE
jgi:ComF family protein